MYNHRSKQCNVQQTNNTPQEGGCLAVNTPRQNTGCIKPKCVGVEFGCIKL